MSNKRFFSAYELRPKDTVQSSAARYAQGCAAMLEALSFYLPERHFKPTIQTDEALLFALRAMIGATSENHAPYTCELQEVRFECELPF